MLTIEWYSDVDYRQMSTVEVMSKAFLGVDSMPCGKRVSSSLWQGLHRADCCRARRGADLENKRDAPLLLEVGEHRAVRARLREARPQHALPRAEYALHLPVRPSRLIGGPQEL
eukprot:CAMPEP_0118944270 /NCGR_PEP_ID=MMETSP1169-20130426/39985_1 /TAXON_ID=36882 /ORGANISM="Pyramimonas obovata, Strain CCMP722" /LENGTH=113 /DNA_ID=CAMNT_0006889723 /DNA_START=85 /DNA_END=423 /DNA_ORIENTATION=-